MDIKPACGLQDSEVRLRVRAAQGPVSPTSFMAADVEMCRWAVLEIESLRDTAARLHVTAHLVTCGLPAQGPVSVAGAIPAQGSTPDGGLIQGRAGMPGASEAGNGLA